MRPIHPLPTDSTVLTHENLNFQARTADESDCFAVGTRVGVSFPWHQKRAGGDRVGMRYFFLRYAKDFLIPMAMALVFAAVLDPITRRLRAIGLAASFAAAFTVLFALFVIGGSIYLVSDDFAAAIEKLTGDFNRWPLGEWSVAPRCRGSTINY